MVITPHITTGPRRLIEVPTGPSLRREPPARGKRPTRSVEIDLWEQGLRAVAGVDEVGRGALAGPVVSGAVSFAPGARPRWLRDLRDSKELTALQRGRLAPLIKSSVAAWAVGWASSEEVDRYGILPATRLSMQRALAGLADEPEFILVDGNDRHVFSCGFQTIKKGDARVASIAAASVVAKVTRDAWMEAIDGRFPAYGFAGNKGYGTAEHNAALIATGPCPEHRRSFAPVREAASDAPRELGLPLFG
jgi:ribonuclease HII